MRWADHVVRMAEMRNDYEALIGNFKGKKPHGSPRCRCEDNIRKDLREIGR